MTFHVAERENGSTLTVHSTQNVHMLKSEKDMPKYIFLQKKSQPVAKNNAAVYNELDIVLDSDRNACFSRFVLLLLRVFLLLFPHTRNVINLLLLNFPYKVSHVQLGKCLILIPLASYLNKKNHVFTIQSKLFKSRSIRLINCVFLFT